jgi:hypothetical protein
MKTIALMLLVLSNGVMAQYLPCFKQDIYRALDTVGTPNIVRPHPDLDAAAAYIAKIKINYKSVDLKAVSDSFNIHVFRYFIYGITYISPEFWKQTQLKNIIRRHAPLHELLIHPDFMSVVIDKFEDSKENYIIIIAYGTKGAICRLPKRTG